MGIYKVDVAIVDPQGQKVVQNATYYLEGDIDAVKAEALRRFMAEEAVKIVAMSWQGPLVIDLVPPTVVAQPSANTHQTG